MTETRFLRLSQGWLNPNAVRWAEEQDGWLVISVAGKEHPIALKGEDARKARLCLDKHAFSLPDLEAQEVSE